VNRIQCTCGTIYQVEDGCPMVCPECHKNGGTIIVEPKKVVVKDIDTTKVTKVSQESVDKVVKKAVKRSKKAGK
jgi:hypothetical protein